MTYDDGGCGIFRALPKLSTFLLYTRSCCAQCIYIYIARGTKPMRREEDCTSVADFHDITISGRNYFIVVVAPHGLKYMALYIKATRDGVSHPFARRARD